MHKILGTSFIALMPILLFVGCNQEENLNGNIDPEFEVYVNRFFEQAENRSLDLSGFEGTFTVQFGDIGGRLANGICRTRSRDVVIHKNRWLEANDRWKERLIFHELGHCLLGRGHRESVLANGECVSIMKGDQGESCLSNVISDLWQSYYYDELFDASVPPPEWYKTELSIAPSSGIIDTSVVQNNFLSIRLEEEVINFQIKATFKNWDQRSAIHLIIDDFDFFATKGITGIKYQNDFMYYKRDLYHEGTTSLRLIEDDGLIHFMIEDKIFHTMEPIHRPEYITMRVENYINESIKLPLELQVDLL